MTDHDRTDRAATPGPGDLAALADGSLPPARREAVEAAVAASPELRRLVAAERRAVAAIGRLDDPAPEDLRRRVAAVPRGSPRAAPARGRRRAAALAAAAAAAAIVVAVLGLPGGSPTAPPVAEAARLGIRPPTQAAPPVDPRRRSLLALSADGLAYPTWARYGWRAVGARVDRLDGRRATTVFYERDRRRIAYTIVAAPALRQPAGARMSVRRGTELRALSVDDRHVVTWRRGGRTCVLSGAGVADSSLAELAAWSGQPGTPGGEAPAPGAPRY